MSLLQQIYLNASFNRNGIKGYFSLPQLLVTAKTIAVIMKFAYKDVQKWVRKHSQVQLIAFNKNVNHNAISCKYFYLHSSRLLLALKIGFKEHTAFAQNNVISHIVLNLCFLCSLLYFYELSLRID